MSNTRVLGPARAPSLIPVLNPLIRRLIGAGLPFGPNVLLTVRGRTSGMPRTFPVAIVELDGRRFVQSPFGEVNWVRNLREAQEAVVSKGRSREEVEAVEVAPEVGGPILRALDQAGQASGFSRWCSGGFSTSEQIRPWRTTSPRHGSTRCSSCAAAPGLHRTDELEVVVVRIGERGDPDIG